MAHVVATRTLAEWTHPRYGRAVLPDDFRADLRAAALELMQRRDAEPTGTDFDRLWAAVRLRWLHNATHKRGFRLQEKPPLNPLLHAIEEATEVARADICAEGLDRIEEEVGDMLVGLLIYVEARGLDFVCLLRHARLKLAKDIQLPEGVKETT